ncbi:MAG: hypothetical protein CL678_01565 [Bdellovibrionaceae bacterium]|nr:hypothetical protein [Pseudobdellovibrionaceae bacterium]
MSFFLFKKNGVFYTEVQTEIGEVKMKKILFLMILTLNLSIIPSTLAHQRIGSFTEKDSLSQISPKCTLMDLQEFH